MDVKEVNELSVHEAMDKSRTFLSVSEKSKSHGEMRHTTKLDIMELIFSNRTLRSSSLISAGLNDPLEKDLVGISNFAGSRFISCFSHGKEESAWFWTEYGNETPPKETDKSAKVLLIFKNFTSTNRIEDLIYLDYAFVEGDKKCSFKRPCFQSDYNQRTFIDSFSVLDTEYLPENDNTFLQSYEKEVVLTASNTFTADLIETKTTGKFLGKLGKVKTDKWAKEQETRILLTLYSPDFKAWEHIDLRLKDEFFRDAVIVLSPWRNGETEGKVRQIIEKSPICDSIKSTISIRKSEYEGLL